MPMMVDLELHWLMTCPIFQNHGKSGLNLSRDIQVDFIFIIISLCIRGPLLGHVGDAKLIECC